MKKLYFLFILHLSIFAFCQNYKSIDTADYAQRKDFIKKFNDNNDALITKYKAQYPGKTGNEVKSKYIEFQEDFVKNVKNKDFLFSSKFEETIDKIITELKKNNSFLPQDLKVLIAKDNSPNAYCLADGTFIINMGLFSWLDNDDQIAGVIAHELGHRILEHSLKTVVANIDDNVIDKSRVDNLKKIKANKNERAFSIVKDRIYRKSSQSRKYEIQADSLGYEIFRKSSYKKQEYINAYKNLQKYDTISPTVVLEETYKSLYTLPKLAFKEKWLNKEDFSLYNYDLYKEKLEKDSLSSHPETELRLDFLRKTFPELKTAEKANEGSAIYKSLQKTARMEIVPNFYHSEDYGFGIYASMQFLQDKEEEVYYKYWLGKCFQKIAEARKNYNLNRYLDRVNPKEQSESYQQFLNFMWNLSVDDIESIAAFYVQK
jgi:hypothetical protein